MEKLEVLVRNVAQYDLIECEGVTQTYLKSPPLPIWNSTWLSEPYSSQRAVW